MATASHVMLGEPRAITTSLTPTTKRCAGALVQHVGSLAAEAMSLVDADGGAEVGDGCPHPLLEAKTPRELALLVKHYRLLQARQKRSFWSPCTF